MSLSPDDARSFGFSSERWFEILRSAETRQEFGHLGGYELLEEVGRGGQGVVFRARQAGTGREVALKRLLGGTLASPRALRRFEREIDVASSLNHPGIVTVYGVEVVDCAPLLAMEWIEGVPVTRWASGRSRREVLELFLLVCDAVQHAHARGVLHRDLKPSNVLVDRAGRPRVLDFGLAKLASEREGTITASGDFLGTPAYAAPEQWRREELDVRADVYSLGAILFEMLTGRRVVEGGLPPALAPHGAPTPRPPSSVVRGIPRELDALVLQALHTEQSARYQSVDALAADLRRFLAGQPVLAHAPSAWFKLRKLVARNRLVTSLLVALLLANCAYLVVLANERDRALRAGVAEREARLEADARRASAERLETEAQEQRSRAEEAAENAESVLSFLLEDVVRSADPRVGGAELRLIDALRSAIPRIPLRFAANPGGESRVRKVLADGLYHLGSYAEAEEQARAALDLARAQEGVTPRQLAEAESLLGEMLAIQRENEEAECWLRFAIAHAGAAVPPHEGVLGAAYNNLSDLLYRQGRLDEASVALELGILFTPDERGRLVLRVNQAMQLVAAGHLHEARERLETLPWRDQPPHDRALLCYNLGVVHLQLREVDMAEAYFSESIELGAASLGGHHPLVAHAKTCLAEILLGRDVPRALALALEAEPVQRALVPGSLEHAQAQTVLGRAYHALGQFAEAESPLREALPVLAQRAVTHEWWELAALTFSEVLLGNGSVDEAEAVLDELEQDFEGRGGRRALPHRFAWLALRRAGVHARRGDEDLAAESYERAIEGYAALGAREDEAKAMEHYARFLRRTGDGEGADALEAEASVVRRGLVGEERAAPHAGAGQR